MALLLLDKIIHLREDSSTTQESHREIGRTTLVIMSLYYAVSGLLLQWLPLPAGLAGLGWGGGVMLLRMGQQSQ